MSLNGISELATKELKQKVKLDLVALKRQGNVLNSDGTVYSTPLGSAQFNGSNQYLTIPADPAFALGTGDFTVETWVYLSSAPGEYAVIDCEGTGQFGFLINSTDIIAFASVAEAYSFTSAVSASEWHHIAFCRIGTTLTCYLDGVSVGTPATSSYDFTSPGTFTIGRNPGANSQYLNGYLSNLRIVKGQALYTSNFTPPTSTLTAVAGTQLLLLNGTTEFVDGSNNQFTITNGTGVTLSATAPTLAISAPFYRARATYDLTLLPTQYNDDGIIDNPNVGGLVVGRPWIETVSTFTFYEAFGTTSAISTTQFVSGNKIYVESSTYDVPSYQPARVAVNDIEIVNTEERGHTLVILDSYGNTVSITNYDTFETVESSGDGGAPARLALQTALAGVETGNIVILVVYDASSVDSSVRSAINTGYESTNSNTWTASRKSHILIGEKVEVTTPSLRSFLSGSGQTAYDAASANSFFAVSSTDYNAVVAGVASTSTVGPSDAQFTGTTGNAFSSGYIITYPQANATVPANNYIIGFRATTDYSNQQWRIYGGPTFKSTSPVYSQIATTSPATASTGTYYYLRKAPTVQAATTYIGIYGTQNLTQTANAVGFWVGGGYTSGAFTTWSNFNNNMPKVQVLITPTAVT